MNIFPGRHGKSLSDAKAIQSGRDPVARRGAKIIDRLPGDLHRQPPGVTELVPVEPEVPAHSGVLRSAGWRGRSLS